MLKHDFEHDVHGKIVHPDVQRAADILDDHYQIFGVVINHWRSGMIQVWGNKEYVTGDVIRTIDDCDYRITLIDSRTIDDEPRVYLEIRPDDFDPEDGTDVGTKHDESTIETRAT